MKKLTLLTISTALLIVGCSELAKPGALEFEWRLGSQGCQAYEVDTVKASLFGFSQADAIFADTYDCEMGLGSLTDVTPGEYTFVLEGKDVDGCVTHEARLDLVLGAGQLMTFERPFGLLRKRRPIELTWNFANQLDCVGNDIAQVEILLDVGDVQSYSEIRACEGFKTTIQSDILPDDIDVTVYGVDTNGQRVMEGRVQISRGQFFEAPCDPIIRTLVLLETCAQSNCEF